MEALRELLAPKTVNKFSFTANVCWFVSGAILSSVFLDMEINERFYCDANDSTELIQGKCYEQYEKRYNKLSIPVYAFVIFNFSIISIVGGIYSQYVKTRVSRLDRELQQPCQPQQRSPPRTLFKAYCFQLVVRFLLGILCICLQKSVFYPQNFPSNFTCDLMRNDQPSENISKTQTYDCHNQRATKKNFWTYTVIVLNIFFAFLVLIEIFYIILRVCKYRRFMEDLRFYNFYLRSQASVLPKTTPMFIQAMKDNIIKETDRIRELQFPFRPNPGEGTVPKDLKPDQIYTNLIIHEGRVEYGVPVDRCEQLNVFCPNPENSSPAKPSDIVDDPQNKRKVLVVGPPGIGKSLFCIKFLRDWALGNSKLYFEAAFLLKFKRFNLVEGPLTLRELLLVYSEYSIRMDDEEWNYIIDDSNRVLVIFDGIDEFKLKRDISEIPHHNYPNDVTERMPFAALYNKLASGKLLTSSTMLTTTRPTAASCVRHLNFDRTVEILGFTSEEIKDYVNKFTEDEQEGTGKTIWQHISSNPNISSLCYVPVNCFIICTCLLHALKSNVSTLLPTKLTEIYGIAIKMFYFMHSRNDEQYSQADFIREPFESLPVGVKDDFEQLAKIAFTGLREGRQILESREVKGLEDCGLLHRLRDLNAQRPFEKPEAQFCFMHLTIQEFFAAMYVTYSMNGEERQKFVDDGIRQRWHTWHVVLQFLAGLLSKREASLTQIFVDALPSSTESFNEREQKAEFDDDEVFDSNVRPTQLIFWPLKTDRDLVASLSVCLYEIDVDDPILQTRLCLTGFNAADFSDCQLKPVECLGVANLLKSQKELVSLDLNNSDLVSLGCKQICLLLKSSDNKLCRLNLSNNRIEDEGVEYLAEALTHSNCKLNNINLSKNFISDKGVMHLAEALTQSNCKLNRLNLSSGNIGKEGVMYLAKVLTYRNCKLNSLNLSSNYISDDGAKHLAGALTNGNCKLNSLVLSFGNLSLEGVKHLATALTDSSCKLKSLDLSGNTIREEGVKHLTEALTRSNSKLKSLTLSSQSIGHEGAILLNTYSKTFAAHGYCKIHTV